MLVLNIKNLKPHYFTEKGPLRAVNGALFEIAEGKQLD